MFVAAEPISDMITLSPDEDTTSMYNSVKSHYLRFQDWLSDNKFLKIKWFIEQEINTWKNWRDLSPRYRLWLWWHGFTSPNGKLYDFDTYGPEAYLSERQRYELFKNMNGAHRYLLDDKLCCHWMLHDFPEFRPRVYGLADRGLLRPVTAGSFDGTPVRLRDWLPTQLKESSTLVLKHLRGTGGKQVYLCEYDAGDYFLNGSRVTVTELCERANEFENYIITDFVDQHSYADDLYEGATNTVRIISIWDDESKEIVIPAAVQRIGTDRSKPADNWSSGGLSANIDIETGEIGRAAQLPSSGDMNWFKKHPETGSKIAGKRIPRWEAIKGAIEEIAMCNTNVPAVGWDVILDESETPVVIEANTGTDVNLLQIHEPLLTDERSRQIISKHL